MSVAQPWCEPPKISTVYAGAVSCDTFEGCLTSAGLHFVFVCFLKHFELL